MSLKYLKKKILIMNLIHEHNLLQYHFNVAVGDYF